MKLHRNAKTTPSSRAILVQRVLREDWSVGEAAEAFGISARTAYKWLARARSYVHLGRSASLRNASVRAMQQRSQSVPVEGGSVPIDVLGPEDASQVPGLVVVPSIFGPAPDLLKQMSELGDATLAVVTDPFWRVGGGVVPYDDHTGAFERLRGFDREQCFADIRAVIDWTRSRCNGRVAGLGICFGGPVVLVAAGEGALDGVIAWHGTRMEDVLDRVGAISCPMKFHFGSDDPVTPPDVIEKIRAAFGAHPDVSLVIHPGLVHGFSHEGESYDPAASLAGLEDTRALLAGL